MKTVFHQFIIFSFFASLSVFPDSIGYAANPILIVGDQNHIPFEFIDKNGNNTGILIHIWKLWSEKTGIPIHFRLASSVESFHMVLKGEADIIGAASESDDYKDLFDYSNPYLNIEYYIFYHNELKQIHTLNDLTAFRIGVVAGDFADFYLQHQPTKYSTISFPTMKELVDNVYNGSIRVFISNTPEALFHLADRGESWRFKLSEKPVAVLNLCAAVRKGNHKMLTLVNQGLSSIHPSEIEAIRKTWSGASFGHQIPWPLVGIAILVLLIFVAGFILWFWNYQLNHKVKSATAGLLVKHQQFEESEQALRKSEEKYKTLYSESKRSEDMYRSLLQSSTDAIVIYSMNGHPTYINPSFAAIFGWTLDEIKSEQIPFVPEAERVQTENVISKLLKTKAAHRGFETKRLTKKGDILDVSIGASCFYDLEGNATGLLSVIRDISETKKLEVKLRQAQKMEAIGTLAGGVAHDFNNILMAIIGYAELAKRNTSEAESNYMYLQQILKAGDRAAALVRQILTFSRKEEQELKPIQINLIIKEAIKLIRASFPSTIELQQYIDDKNSIVNMDPTQIHQVLLNLCTNAHHAMREKGGVLEVRLEVAEVSSEALVLYPNLEPGSFVKLSVRDTGHGMKPEILERVFDPYFTTKKKDEGTGLGLAVVQGIVAGHGGFITVESKIGEGSLFCVFFPRIDEQSQTEHDESHEAIVGGKERILFVDDEESIVEISQEILSQFGYEVVTMTRSTSALALFQKDPQKFDLVITDMTMPQMTGIEMALQILKIRPDMPIIVCTGFSDVMNLESAKKLGIKEFLLKPVNYNLLSQIIRDLVKNKT